MIRMEIGTVVGRRVETDGRLKLKLELSAVEDVRFVEMAHGGEDSPPIDGDYMLVVTVFGSYQTAYPLGDNVPTGMGPGERHLYSRDLSGTIKAFVKLLSSGTLVLNGDVDNAVRYSALETAFNQLKYDHDNHVHWLSEETTTGNTTTGSSADISPAKVDTVTLP